MSYKSIHDIVLDLTADSKKTDLTKTATSGVQLEKAAELIAYLRGLADSEEDVQKQASVTESKEPAAKTEGETKTDKADDILDQIRNFAQTKTEKTASVTTEPEKASVPEKDAKTTDEGKSLRDLLVATATAHKAEG
jgi:hypothetical protein